jgi:hypothetical protein
MQMKGTLPAVITSTDLECLNVGLQFLFADLRTARGEYVRSQRDSVLIALGALMRFTWLFEATLAERLDLPIGALRGALFGLDENIVEPLLEPVARAGRSGSSMARQALKGHVAAAVQRLLQAGFSTNDAAHRLIAKELNKLGIRPERGSGHVTATTVRHWCDEVEQDVGRRGAAAVAYDMTFTDDEIKRFKALPTDKARQDQALSCLAAVVGELFPRSKTQ